VLRQGSVLVCGLVASILCTCFIPAARGQAGGSTLCKRGYKYAGLQSATGTSGIRANLKILAQPVVLTGHVAGWVGVGGPNAGPGGTAQWLQVGYFAFPDGSMQLYYEVELPNSAPQYHVVKGRVTPGEAHLVSIREVSGHPGMWQIRVDGVPVGPAYFLAGSHGRYQPQGIGESWNPTASECNTYAWLFRGVEVAKGPGGSWVVAKSSHQWHDAGYSLKLIPPDSFATVSR